MALMTSVAARDLVRGPGRISGLGRRGEPRTGPGRRDLAAGEQSACDMGMLGRERDLAAGDNA